MHQWLSTEAAHIHSRIILFGAEIFLRSGRLIPLASINRLNQVINILKFFMLRINRKLKTTFEIKQKKFMDEMGLAF